MQRRHGWWSWKCLVRLVVQVHMPSASPKAKAPRAATVRRPPSCRPARVCSDIAAPLSAPTARGVHHSSLSTTSSTGPPATAVATCSPRSAGPAAATTSPPPPATPAPHTEPFHGSPPYPTTHVETLGRLRRSRRGTYILFVTQLNITRKTCARVRDGPDRVTLRPRHQPDGRSPRARAAENCQSVRAFCMSGGIAMSHVRWSGGQGHLGRSTVGKSRSTGLTVGEFLGEWLWGKQSLRPSTHRAYETPYSSAPCPCTGVNRIDPSVLQQRCCLRERG
jgi:hypothetical protein